jgi:3-oxoacyl-[acyl-carrier protein] reductase
MIRIALDGKSAIVTGASQGLGEITARRLHEGGARVAVCYFPSPDGAHRAKAERIVADLGDGAVAVPCDVRDPASATAMADEVMRVFGRIDIVVNNAGIIADRSLKKMADEEWRAVIDTNLTGVFNVCRVCAERMSDCGRIVNFSSISAVVGFFGQANYAASKAGVIALTKVLSRELAKRRITVNAVAPGVVLTEMGRTIPEEVRAEMLRQVPLARFGEPREIADVVLFLCSDLASYVTGQVIHANGGWTG